MGFIAVKCPGCGANIQLDDSREFGFCTYCGTKVVQDKIVVEHRGSVQLDDAEALNKLYQAARNAIEISDTDTALRHYETISAKDPNSWEAMFFIVVLRLDFEHIPYSELSEAAVKIQNCLPKVFELIQRQQTSEEDKKEAVDRVIHYCDIMANEMMDAAFIYYDSVAKKIKVEALTNGLGGMVAGAGSMSGANQQEVQRCLNIANIMCICGNQIEALFNMQDSFYRNSAIFGWKRLLDYNTKYRNKHNANLLNDESIRKFSMKINQYDNSFAVQGSTNTSTKSGGCYVATCVYGSYDCPQVWTLRRYRDETLASTWYGRAFIRAYYAVSPTLVAWFGHTDWFKKLWRGKLDRMVESLQKDGVKNTPYEDR